MYAETLTVTGASRPEFALSLGLDRYFVNPTGALFNSIGSAIGKVAYGIADGLDAGINALANLPQAIANLPSALAYKLTGGSVGSDFKFGNVFGGTATNAVSVGGAGGVAPTSNAQQPGLVRSFFERIGNAVSGDGWNTNAQVAAINAAWQAEVNHVGRASVLKAFYSMGSGEATTFINDNFKGATRDKMLAELKLMETAKNGTAAQKEALRREYASMEKDERLLAIINNNERLSEIYHTADMQLRVREGDSYWKKEALRKYDRQTNSFTVDGVKVNAGQHGRGVISGGHETLWRNMIRAASETNVEEFLVGRTGQGAGITHSSVYSMDVFMIKFHGDASLTAYKRPFSDGMRGSLEAFERNFFNQAGSEAVWSPYQMLSKNNPGQGISRPFFSDPNGDRKTFLDTEFGNRAINLKQGEDDAHVLQSRFAANIPQLNYNRPGLTPAERLRLRNEAAFAAGSVQHYHHGHFMITRPDWDLLR